MSSPNVWMIGDIQGCCSSLDKLLAHPLIAQDPEARFWFAGDLVNRGPQSLATIRYLMQIKERSVVLLGNHDLHLLAVAAGVRSPGKNDTLREILMAPDAGEIIDWVRHQKLAHFENEHLMVHAGVLPKWDTQKTLALAGEAEQALQGKNWRKAIEKMYGNEPNQWKDDYTGGKRLRAIVNALTRLRMCTPKGQMALAIKSSPGEHHEGLVPWFDVADRATRDITVVFGHWSTLGLLIRPDVICLDTGCVWGGHLTAVRQSDKMLIQIPCHQTLDPLAH